MSMIKPLWISILALALATLVNGQNSTMPPDQSSDQGVKSDMKDAGHDTARAAKKTGHKVKRGSKKAAHKTAEKTRQGSEKVEDKTATPPR